MALPHAPEDVPVRWDGTPFSEPGICTVCDARPCAAGDDACPECIARAQREDAAGPHCHVWFRVSDGPMQSRVIWLIGNESPVYAAYQTVPPGATLHQVAIPDDPARCSMCEARS